jgi:hypothetical protein
VGRRRLRILGAALALLLAVDLALWGVRLFRREAQLRALAPMVSQMDSLAARIAVDDDWIDRNQRLLQGYGQHADLAQRLRERGQRVVAHDALVDAYNDRIVELLRRPFYLPPLPRVGVEPRERLGR